MKKRKESFTNLRANSASTPSIIPLLNNHFSLKPLFEGRNGKKKERKKDQEQTFSEISIQTRVTQFRVGRFIVATATFRDKRKRGGGSEKLAGISYGWCRKKSI